MESWRSGPSSQKTHPVLYKNGSDRPVPRRLCSIDGRPQLAREPSISFTQGFSVAAILRISSGVCSPASGVPGIK
jgi:hypothetical protein